MNPYPNVSKCMAEVFMKTMGKASLIFWAVILSLAWGCGDKVQPGRTVKPGPVVKGAVVTKVQESQETQMYEAMGTVKALTTSRLASKLMGTVLKVNVQEGDRVKKGQPLVFIDDRQVKAQLERANAGLLQAKKALKAAIYAHKEAKAARDLAYATYKRYLNLKKQDAVSDQEFDEVQSQYHRAEAALSRTAAMVQTARAKVKEAKAAVAAASVRRKDAIVAAPEDGVVASKTVDVGDLVAPGTPVLTIDSTGRYRVDVLIPESHIHYLRLGKKVEILIPAMANMKTTGTITTITPAADPASRSFLVKISLPQENIPFKSGMFARVFIPMPGGKKILIPRNAIVRVGQLQGVYVVDGENVAHFRLIKTGRYTDGQVEILSGLEPGERIVSVLPPDIVDGARLEGVS